MAEKQLEINPRNTGILVDLVSFNINLENLETAGRLLKRVVAMEPGDSYLQHKIGIMYEYLGDRKNALEWIEKAVNSGYPAEEITKNPDELLTLLWEDERFLEIVNEQK